MYDINGVRYGNADEAKKPRYDSSAKPPFDAQKLGEGLVVLGKGLMGCGCLVVTLPFFLIILALLFSVITS